VPGFDSISQDQLLDRIAGLLEWERTRRPAFTLLLGSGFSAPLIPTAGQVVARDVAWWLYWRRRAREGEVFELRAAPDTDEMRSFERDLWTSVCAECAGSFELQDGLPATDAENIGGAYRAIMSGLASRGLSDPQRRRRYLRDLCARIGERVNGAHIFLASILRAQERWAPDLPWKRPFCRTIFTTNFDPLLQRSLQLVSRLYFMSDRPEALEPPEDEDQDAIHLVYSHGSVHRYLLLNTTEEIEKARARNASALVPYLQRHGVLVIGYSGWLDATMEALSHCNSFDGNLYWCDVYGPEEAAKRLSAVARDLLASKAGYAYYVPIAGADELMLALHRKLGLGDAPGFIRDPIGQMIEDLVSVEVPDAREPANEPRAIDTLKDSRDRTVTRLHAAQRVFENPEQIQAGGEREVTADDQRVYDEAVTAKLMDEALGRAQSGDLEQAIQLWTMVSDDERVPSAVRAQALFNRGFIRGKQHRLDQEIEDYIAAIAMPGAPAQWRAKALVNRGVAHGRAGRRDQEIADFTAVTAMLDASVDLRAAALLNRGVAHRKAGRPDQAIRDYTGVIAMPDVPTRYRAQALINRGVVLNQDMGQHDQATSDYSEALAMSDTPAALKAMALGNRAWSRFMAQPRDVAALREESEAALAIKPQLTFARFNLGLALLLAGEPQRAIAEYARAAEEATADQIHINREDLERATTGKQFPGAEEILGLLRAREAELAASAEQPPDVPASGSP
jgi:tetratricopeptide (TPR) repeat protein